MIQIEMFESHKTEMIHLFLDFASALGKHLDMFLCLQISRTMAMLARLGFYRHHFTDEDQDETEWHERIGWHNRHVNVAIMKIKTGMTLRMESGMTWRYGVAQVIRFDRITKYLQTFNTLSFS